MDNQQDMHAPRTLRVQFEVVPADVENPDPATLGDVARGVVNMLHADGYIARPAYTGTKGGALYDILIQVGDIVRDNKELLGPIVSLTTAIVSFLAKKRDEQGPVEVSIEVNTTVVNVNMADVANDVKLLEKLLLDNPKVIHSLTSENNIRILVGVPAKPNRKNR